MVVSPEWGTPEREAKFMPKVVQFTALPQGIDPNARKARFKVAFAAEAVVLVREIGVITATHTKIVFRGDNYEHHAIETDMPYDEVMRLIGWE